MYDSNNYCDAVRFSGATSDYTKMRPIYDVLGYGSGSYGTNGSGFGGVFNSTNIHYTQNADGSINYTNDDKNDQKNNRIMFGIGALGNIFSAIGSGMLAQDQAKVQQQEQIWQYQAYQQQSAQLAQQQQKQQSMASMQSMFQMMMMMKQFETMGTETVT